MVFEMITFKPLQQNDFSLLAHWFKQPHVAQWWPTESAMSDAEIKAKYLAKMQSHDQEAFIVYLDDIPIGYMHYYDACKKSPAYCSGTYGIDQFIGEPDCIGKGYGTQMVRAFVQMLFDKPDVTRIIADPDSTNEWAIHCYEKVRFKRIGLIDTPGGVVMLMELEKGKYREGRWG